MIVPIGITTTGIYPEKIWKNPFFHDPQRIWNDLRVLNNKFTKKPVVFKKLIKKNEISEN